MQECLCRYNETHPEGENKALLYHEFPQHYTWQEGAKRWQLRQSGGAIGRMYITTPSRASRFALVPASCCRVRVVTCWHALSFGMANVSRDSIEYTTWRIPHGSDKDSLCGAGQGEKHYLRLMLLHVRGASSFADLKTVHGIERPTFKEAAEVLGLLHDDREVERAILEAAQFSHASHIRGMVAFLLGAGEMNEPGRILEEYMEVLAEDFLYEARQASSLPSSGIASFDAVTFSKIAHEVPT